MVFARADAEKYATLIRDNVDWLEKRQIGSDNRNRRNQKPWYAGAGRIRSVPSAMTATIPIPSSPSWRCTRPSASACRPAAQTWQRAKEYWEKCQNRRRLVGLQAGQITIGTGSMTCAGITSLVIASDRVHAERCRGESGDRIECCLPHRGRR